MSVNDKMTAIANAIRAKTGDTAALTLDEMATAISGISGGGGASYDISVGYLEGTTSKPVLDPSATSIRAFMFYNYAKLALTSLPSGLTSIGSNAFKSCMSIESITFEGTPDSINSSAFKYCTRLLTLNVPWAEGAVANAPWGATKATINYNYTGA